MGSDGHPHGQEDAGKRESKLERLKKSSGKIRHVCCIALKVIYVILAVIIILVAIAVMLSAVAVATGLAVTMTGQALRAAGLTVLTLTALLTAAAAAAASHAVCVTKRKQLKISSIILAVTAALAILVAVLVGLPSEAEQQALSESLLESFRLAAGPNQDSMHVKRWDSTQSSLKCCGFNSPNDYKASPGASPDVPFPCCPAYDESKPFPQQEVERKYCNLKREYYKEGCESKVQQGLKAVGYAIISVTISLVVLQLILVVLGVAVLAEKSHRDLEKNGKVLSSDVENSNPSNK